MAGPQGRAFGLRKRPSSAGPTPPLKRTLKPEPIELSKQFPQKLRMALPQRPLARTRGQVPLPPDVTPNSALCSHPADLTKRLPANSQIISPWWMMPPSLQPFCHPRTEWETTEFSALVSSDELADPSASTETRSEHSLPPAQSPYPPRNYQDFHLARGARASSLLADVAPGLLCRTSLPPDQAVVALWQYVHTLEAQHAGPMTLARALPGPGAKKSRSHRGRPGSPFPCLTSPLQSMARPFRDC